MPRFDVTAMGEIMLRLSVPVGERLELARTLAVHPGGAEGNVLVALARLGRQTAWCSGLPDNATGRLIANHLQLAGVDLSCVHWSAEGRTGLYFLEFADPPRNVDVVYDRAASCAACLSPSRIDWNTLMDTRHFHISGITPALSPAGLEATRTALREARARHVTCSLDVNYRAKMWTREEARAVLMPLMAEVDILFCGRGDAETVFGLHGDPEQTLHALAPLAPGACIVMSQSDRGIWALAEGQVQYEPARSVTVMDRLGAGDAMAAGVIHGWLDHDLALGLRYGALLAAMVLTQHGDMLVTTRSEVDTLLATGGGMLDR